MNSKTVRFLGEEKTIDTDVYDIWLEGRNIEHGLVVGLRSFTDKKKPSLFDDLVKAIDKSGMDKKLNKWLKETRIFNFDETVCYNIDKLDSLHAEAELQRFYDIPLEPDMLGLPFNNTCIVTPDCAMMLNELDDPTKYFFSLLVNMHGKTDMQWLCFGLIDSSAVVTKASNLRAVTELLFLKMPNGKFQLYHKSSKDRNELVNPMICKAMGLIMQLNTPDRFIMEVSPVKTDVKSSKYIPRSHQRPEYLVLHPHVIRKYMKTESDTEGHARRGHERRAHLRRYPDDPIRYPKAHGKTIRIEAVWIGRTEVEHEGRKYKVIL